MWAHSHTSGALWHPTGWPRHPQGWHPWPGPSFLPCIFWQGSGYPSQTSPGVNACSNRIMSTTQRLAMEKKTSDKSWGRFCWSLFNKRRSWLSQGIKYHVNKKRLVSAVCFNFSVHLFLYKSLEIHLPPFTMPILQFTSSPPRHLDVAGYCQATTALSDIKEIGDIQQKIISISMDALRTWFKERCVTFLYLHTCIPRKSDV